MKLYSTNDKNNIVSLKEAVLHSLPKDKGLYMPIEIPKMPLSFFENIETYTFQEISFEVAHTLIGNYIPSKDLRIIIDNAINFSAPVVMHDDTIGTLELWHGPSLAFKDFGARFMAELMSYFNKNEDKKTTILVATSGDTGGAVAAGFYNTPGIEVIILYPKGKVSDLQEKQLTTLGKNISAIELEGTFDDCQSIVKQAFLDSKLSKIYNLSSANSINIARLIPQTFYYFEAYKQIKKHKKKIVVSVPSGNFGNLTAGLIAKRMGLPIDHFIAATNANRVVPEFLDTGIYNPKPSISTISNAMDVGAPSNFVRLLALYNANHDTITKDISGFSLNDEEDRLVMKEIFDKYNYIADPHGAIAYAAVKTFITDNPKYIGLYFETAHPAKFLDIVNDVLQCSIDIPERLVAVADKIKVASLLPNKYKAFYDWMKNRKK
ncbi:MAG: threonine synthase [Saprospiraceae bacterium]